ncbi:major histocompatibility complex class I-related gene protein-like isoform X1 [Python bivittatus]|uniref:Major histocompatibility complex class I-related gene protein-like isoform X1 n=1 Tax=Python bivittatus TaxID=176946 RepID=A0A9F5JC48_PYTBI|nr:major histocompatibility complex class I-related gene protein-like isoform X1 [Python bivittatus]XP_025032235.1 major histocompatibility complex class I-related gene protein-like isoform X1 [Python bivittatus]
MVPRQAPLWVLGVAAAVLWGSCCGSSSHSLKYFYTVVSDPNQGLTQFFRVNYVDEQPVTHYDSNTRKLQPRIPWIKEVQKEDPQYLAWTTRRVRGHEVAFKADLETTRNRYNHSKGLHILQVMIGCELRADGSKEGFWQDAYDGRTFLTFDKETLTWLAAEPQAQALKRRWDAEAAYNRYRRSHLEETCIKWLQMHLSHGNKTLLRTETPVVTMSSRPEANGMEVHICRVHGFYPKEIDVSWRRDGEVWLQDTSQGVVAPNSDGTYHLWLSVQIDPKERDHYRCYVEHDSLQEPLNVAVKAAESNLELVISCVLAALVLVSVIAVILGYLKKRKGGYRAASADGEGSKG